MAAGSSRNFAEFANSLSFYNTHTLNGQSSGASASENRSSSKMLDLNSSSSSISISLENKQMGFGLPPTTASKSGMLGGLLDRGEPDRIVKEGEEEQKTLIGDYAYKGLSLARQGVESLNETAKAVVGTASNRLQDSNGWSIVSPQRLFYFAVAAAVGCLFMTLAFLMFPLILVAPAKFALMFTLGSLSFLTGFVLLRGFNSFVAHVISWERLPFSFSYVASLLLTLYATLIFPSKLLALLFSLAQIVALVSFLVSYIPGGKSMLKLVWGGVLNMLKGAFKWRSSSEGPSLPI